MGSSATACEGAAVAGRPPYHLIWGSGTLAASRSRRSATLPARGRVEAARVPLPRGAARWCARARSPALFFVGVGGRGRDVGRKT